MVESIRVHLCGVILFLFISSSLHGQSLEEGIYYISGYINSYEYAQLKKYKTDLQLADAIYLKALDFYNGNVSETLFALTFATLPYRQMPLEIPLIKTVLNIPLPSVDEKSFYLKVKNQPSHFFFDSPTSEFGDKDKLAHFFGNAFLSYNIHFFKLSKFMSIFVELFEGAFKVEGGVDMKDFKINTLGEFFGIELIDNNEILPSQFLALYDLYFLTITN
ncbi:MAG: hypothetical protein KJ799_14385 [Bacteroidetes bacterium]|nr:hypothetical protein [Bacteroidota bacterium]